MGMFDDAEKKMAEEAAAQSTLEAQLKAERNQMARQVSEDLTGYLGRQRRLGFEVDLLEDQITLHHKKTGETLVVTCMGRAAGYAISIDGEPPDLVDQDDMAFEVVDWLKRTS
jgi:hypothetical protein